MKRTLAIILLMAMAVCMLCSTPVYASSDEEWIEKYQIPDNWAREALLFAVKNGILAGKGTGGLSPTDTTTRAEAATILTKVLQTQTEADLSGFSDVSSSAWYSAPVAKAVALRLLSGDGNGKLLPNDSITREQTCCVLASAFGVYGGSALDLMAFSDRDTVSSWAVAAVAAMVHNGFLTGADGKLNPKAKITRQEFAQLLYEMISGLGSSIGSTVEGPFVLSAQTVPEGTVVHGDLVLCAETDTVALSRITVSGRLVVQGCGIKTVVLENCSIGCLTLCNAAEVFSDTELPEVEVGQTAVLHADAAQVSLYGQSLTVCEGTAIDCLHVCNDACRVLIDGEVSVAVLEKDRAVLCGSGSVFSVDIFGKSCEVSCAAAAKTHANGAKPENIRLKAQVLSTPTVYAPLGEVEVSVSGADLRQGLENCRLYFFVDGILTDYIRPALCRSGDAWSFSYDFDGFMKAFQEKTPVSAVLCTQRGQYSKLIDIDTSALLLWEAMQVSTSYVYAKVLRDTDLYYDYNDTDDRLVYFMQTVPAGTVVIFNRKFQNVTRITVGSKTGWVRTKDVQNLGKLDYTTQDYTTQIKECYVNRVGNYTSTSRYLIWISVRCQQLNIFEGSQGSWKLIRTADCATGNAYTPSPQSIRSITGKTERRYGGGGFYYYHHITWTGGDVGLHSRIYASGGGFYDATIGKPVSNGCIRLYDADCIWIYHNAPVGTTVVIY